MLFWVSVGLFVTAASISLISYGREQEALPHPNLKKKKNSLSHFQIDQQILYQNHHWTIKKVARATDGIKSLSIAVLEPEPKLWIRLEEGSKRVIDGFYGVNSSIEQERNFAQHFHRDGLAFDFRMKTRMKCHPESASFWEDEQSIEISIYEDKIEKNYFIHIKGDTLSFIFEGDNYASEEMMLLSTN